MTKLGKTFKSWTTPAFSERMLMKGAWKIGKGALKFAFKRPILTAAISYSLGRPLRRRKKYLKNKWGGGPSAGKRIMHKGEWLF